MPNCDRTANLKVASDVYSIEAPAYFLKQGAKFDKLKTIGQFILATLTDWYSFKLRNFKITQF